MSPSPDRLPARAAGAESPAGQIAPVSQAAQSLPTSAFDYDLPAERIARFPVEERDHSRLLVLDRRSGRIRHRVFHEIIEFIEAGDVLVLNETRVFPARLLGRKPSGARVEVLLLRPRSGDADHDADWDAIVRPGAKLKPGRFVEVGDGLIVEILETTGKGARTVRLHSARPVAEIIAQYGVVPLPPYLEREAVALDTERYQTVYARATGSVAAPTAGLHFTPALLAALDAKGVRIARIVLHVGPGTFKPVSTEDPGEHRLHAEPYALSEATAKSINEARTHGRLWAVGTTVVRTLETLATPDGTVMPGSGETALFIRPPYRFQVVDRLITNFHLPRSTLLMLATAFGGYNTVMNAYREAVREGYRFYSYGDAMAIVEG